MAEWEVESEAPARPSRTAGGGRQWEVETERPARQYRGARGNRGVAPIAPDAPGRSPDRPIPYGQPVPVGSYGLDGKGAIVLKRPDGGFNIVRAAPLGGLGLPQYRSRPVPAPARPAGSERGRAPARPREENVFAQVGADLAEPFVNAGNALGAYYNNAVAAQNRGAPRSLAEFGARVAEDQSNGLNLLSGVAGGATAPFAAPINVITRPAARLMTDAGVGNDDFNNANLTTATMLLAPSRPAALASAASTARMAPVTGARPAVGNALADARPYATAPVSRVPAVRAAPAAQTNALADPQPAAVPAAPPARPARPANAATGRRAQLNLLRAEGIEPTPGQRAGPAFAAAEDKAMSAPLVGDAIGGARTRGREQLNRAVANRALGEIGETLPREVRPGRDAYAYTEARVGAVYDQAADLVTSAQIDEAFAQDLASVRARSTDLPTDVAENFENIVKARIARLEGGPVDGATLKQIQSELRGLASKRKSSSDPAVRDMADQLDDVARAVGGIVERNSPEAAALIAKADKGWRSVATMRRAASSVGAPDGIFSPAQLRAAVKASDKSVGKGATARGSAHMQDLSDAANSIMGGNVPDSGTAGRVFFNSLLGTGAAVGAMVSPAALKAAAVALGVSLPYLLTARKLAGTALRAKSAAERAEALASLEAVARETPSMRAIVDRVRTSGSATGPALIANSGSREASQ